MTLQPQFQLLEVEEDWKRGDPKPRLAEASRGRKFSVMPANEIMADWQRFFQQDRDFHGGGLIELQAGWGDIYEWNRSGNYIDFPHQYGLPKRGFYVLQGETDPHDKIIESNETDNMSCTFIEVSRVGREGNVEVLERGYGSDPWDPHKVVLSL